MEIFGLRYIIPSGFLFLPFILATIKFEITYAHIISPLDSIALKVKISRKMRQRATGNVKSLDFPDLNS